MKFINTVLALSFLLMFTGTAMGDETRAKFLQHCASEQGDDAQGELCNCVYTKWAENITADDRAGAALAIDIMVTDREPSMDEAFEVMPHVQNYAMATFECMQLGNDTLASMMNMGSDQDVMKTLLEAEQKNEAEQQKKREQRRAEQQREFELNEAKRNEWENKIKAEETKIGPPLSASVSQFKTLNYLYCEGSDQNKNPRCDCQWNKISSFDSGYGERVTNATAYVIATDYLGDLPFEVNSTEFKQIMKSRESLYNSIQNSCK
ncbi:MAG: hypothetical protein MK188_09165 [Gammaproteobacteria bacterium]|nr:hypothetical protein [Gammaproteobacteria bacterium]